MATLKVNLHTWTEGNQTFVRKCDYDKVCEIARDNGFDSVEVNGDVIGTALNMQDGTYCLYAPLTEKDWLSVLS